jgi:hypothetical protein
MEDVEKASDDENRSRVKDVKIDLGGLDDAEGAGGILDHAIRRSNENKATAEVKNDNPALPWHCDSRALACWSFEDTGVDDM